MSNAQLEELKAHGYYLSVPRGRSMWPMLRDRQDVVEIHRVEAPLRRYDVALYERGADVGVLHRVLHVKENLYIINGDNCWGLEYVRPEQVVGVMTRFCRKGKWVEVTDWRYRLYAHLWVDFALVRRSVIRVRDLARGICGKQLRRLKSHEN